MSTVHQPHKRREAVGGPKTSQATTGRQQGCLHGSGASSLKPHIFDAATELGDKIKIRLRLAQCLLGLQPILTCCGLEKQVSSKHHASLHQLGCIGHVSVQGALMWPTVGREHPILRAIDPPSAVWLPYLVEVLEGLALPFEARGESRQNTVSSNTTSSRNDRCFRNFHPSDSLIKNSVIRKQFHPKL